MPMKMAAAKKRQPFLMQSNYPALAVILEVNHMGIDSVFLIMLVWCALFSNNAV